MDGHLFTVLNVRMFRVSAAWTVAGRSARQCPNVITPPDEPQPSSDNLNCILIARPSASCCNNHPAHFSAISLF